MSASVRQQSGVLCLGETMAVGRAMSIGALRTASHLSLSIAGAESNVAVGVSRLGHPAAWIGRVGADEPGRIVLDGLRGAAVDVSEAVIDQHAATGLMLVERRTADVNRVTYYRADSAGSRLCPDDVPDRLPDDVKVLHISGITFALSASARSAARKAVRVAKAQGVRVSLDINYRSALWSTADAVDALMPILLTADIVFTGADELPLYELGVTEAAAAERLLAEGVSDVIVKHGAKGAAGYTIDGPAWAPAYQVTVTDTVGAGDAFAAGYLSALLDDLPIAERLERGNQVAAFAVGTVGDWEGLPSRAELRLISFDRGETIR